MNNFPQKFENFDRVGLWPYILRHGHCEPDRRFSKVSMAIDEAQHAGGVWNEDELVKVVTEYDKASYAMMSPDEQKRTRTLVFKATLPSRKNSQYDWLNVPDIQSTNAITWDKATNQVTLTLFSS